MSDEAFDDGEGSATNDGREPGLGTSRRRFVKVLGTGVAIGAAGTGLYTGSAGAQATSSSFSPGDGFATVATWLESENVDVYRIQDSTRSAVETAFQASGARIVVFETSGTIDLGGDRLQITEDKCWVAGQTAPSPGITFTRGMVQVSANDCVVQHIRSRIGPGSDGNIQGNDSLNTADDTQNNVVDHVTASWGTDECLSVGYDTTDTTVSNCLVYEGLYDPYGDGSDHNYASLIGDGATNVTLVGNVWAKTRGRVPRLKADTRSAVVNNVMYFYNEATQLDDSTEASIVGNVYLPQDRGDASIEGGNAYLEDNYVEAGSLSSGTTELSSPPLWPDGIPQLPSGDVLDHNLANAGARPADRTAHDQRIVQEIRNREDEAYYDSPYDYWIPDPSAVGGYPDLAVNTHSLSVPDSGLRQWLEGWALAVEDPGVDPPNGSGGDELPAVDGAVPQDLNGDGRHRDLNGNGRLDNDDVVTYFEHMDDAAIQNNVNAYDYNGNGRIDFDDIVSLFESL